MKFFFFIQIVFSKFNSISVFQLFSDDDYKDDDIIFEDFARLRLKGETEA